MGLWISNIIILHKKGRDIEQAKKNAMFMLVSLLLISLLPGISLLGHLGSLLSGFFLGLLLLPGPDKELGLIKKIGIGCFGVYTFVLLAIWF